MSARRSMFQNSVQDNKAARVLSTVGEKRASQAHDDAWRIKRYPSVSIATVRVYTST